MPRLPPFLLQKLSRTKSPLLPLLLRETRDVPSAINELRWLKEFVEEQLSGCRGLSRSILHDYHCNSYTQSQRLTRIQDKQRPHTRREIEDHKRKAKLLKQLCIRRGIWGEPLQYILGNEYFGLSGVEINVQRGVLVPRPETADLVTHFTKLYHESLQQQQSCFGDSGPRQGRGLKILDLCTGSGCIPILLHSLLYPPNSLTGTQSEAQLPTLSPSFLTTSNYKPHPPKLLGLDICPQAISLSRKNLYHNARFVKSISSSVIEFGEIEFLRGDVFDVGAWVDDVLRFFNGEVRDKRAETEKEDGDGYGGKEVDLVISNPPYISPKEYLYTTSRSARKWEPKIALVPTIRDSISLENPINESAFPKGNEPGTTSLGDEFYPHIARISKDILHAKAVIVEVGGDEKQAGRVREIFAGIWGGEENTAIWRDWGGRGRGVVAWRGGERGWSWLRKDMLEDRS